MLLNLSFTNDNNSISNADIYGVLYTWTAALNGNISSNTNPSGIQGVCPDGWHIPSYLEWLELRDYLGGNSVAGEKMKESGIDHWSESNTCATNESGFSALGSGVRWNDGSFNQLNYIAHFWSTYGGGTTAINIAIYDGSCSVYFDDEARNNGKSVRCVKD